MVAAKRILIVEDDTIVQLHLRVLVQDLGYVVSGVAASADEALASADAAPPHLVIMDVRLRGGRDGIEAARELRSRCDPALVFLTAYADERTVERALEAGAQGYVVKPFSKPQLRAALSTALAEHEKKQPRRSSTSSFDAVLGQRGDAVFLLDGGGHVTFQNPLAAALTGVSQRDALDRPILQVLASVLVRGNDGTAAESPSSMPGNRALVVRDATGHEHTGTLEPLTEGGGAALVFRGIGATPRRGSGPAAARVSFGVGARVAIFSHDTLGLGHLQRCTNIARTLTARYPGISVLILTGSPAVHRYALPQGVDYVKLPSVKKTGVESYSARTLGLTDEGVLRLRSNLILRTLQDYDPHVLLVDHAPTGMKGELLQVLAWLGRQRPDCIKMIGLRDVIDEPTAVRALWSERGTYDLLRAHYDHVLVYGSPEIADAATAYGFPEDLRARTHFCNYVGELEDDPAATVKAVECNGRPLVVVTIGGGDGAGELVLGNYLACLRRMRPEDRPRSVLLPGPFLPTEEAERFRAAALELGAEWLDFVPSTSPYIAQSDLVVCTGGYNTTVQTLRFGARALMIPRVMHREEQFVRVKRLVELGFVDCMLPADVTPERLAERITKLLADPARPLRAARARNQLRFDGADRVADIFATLRVRAI